MTARDWTSDAVMLALVACIAVLSVALREQRRVPHPVPHETQVARLAAFERCVESASRAGPSMFSPGDVVRACRDAAVELVAAEQMGPPERGGRP